MPYANINLEGRLVSDPEIKVGSNNREFCTFRVAVNQQFGAQENASFYNCTGNELMASRIKKAGLVKGRAIHINGNLTMREYETRDGTHRLSPDVGILDWHFVGSKPKDDDQHAESTSAKQSGGRVNQEEYVGDPDELPL